MVPVAPQPWRLAFACAAFVALCGWVILRLHHLQVDRGEHLQEIGERQRLRKLEIRAPRGNIFDSSGVPLAVSDGCWSLYADPGYMDDKLRATVELSRVLGLPRDILRNHFEARFNGRQVAKGLDDRTADAIKTLKIAGISLRREFSRIHPEGILAPHVLGFVLNDGSGGAGVEQEFDRVLRGVPGQEIYAVDALGNPVLLEREIVAPKPGAHIRLTIDVTIQRELEQALMDAVTRHRPSSASGMVIRPGTGEIVAMASWPTFNPEDLSALLPDQMRNNALAFVYEPGSTMKPLVAGAAVHEGVATWDKQIFCENGRWTHRVGRSARTITDHSIAHGGHQFLTVIEGIAYSDNILMAKLGIALGPQRLRSWILDFGFGGKTGIDLPGEDAGIVLGEAKWNVMGSCMSIPMGHEIAVTPIQMAMAHAAVANRGVWNPPRLVSRVWNVDDRGRQIERALPEGPAARRMFPAEDALRVQEAMTHTMTEGTGKRATLEGYTSAGKTGTSEKLVNGRYSSEHHVGSFVCWAPAGPASPPELLALVVIDDPRANGHYGSETAAPVVKRVLQVGLEHLGVPHDLPRSTGPLARAERHP